jgi:ACR3 family arsenite efflux pump ArsB
MSPLAILVLLALTGYAIYRQSQRHEVLAHGRFKMAVIYAVAGLLVGGFSQPDNTAEWSLLLISIVLSVVVGLARGRFTRMWTEDRTDGRHVIAQGTPLTIGLFLAMVVAKFGLGTWAYFNHVSDDGGFGEILLMIAVMIALQAELVWRRARALGAAVPVPTRQ